MHSMDTLTPPMLRSLSRAWGSPSHWQRVVLIRRLSHKAITLSGDALKHLTGGTALCYLVPISSVKSAGAEILWQLAAGNSGAVPAVLLSTLLPHRLPLMTHGGSDTAELMTRSLDDYNRLKERALNSSSVFLSAVAFA